MALHDDIVLKAHAVSKKYAGNAWVLKDVSFEARRGQIVGIIGRNGAGKSTLLKILSEIIPPSSGHIEYQGTMLPILETGTGFHPDLSGYENIFFNASLLGLKKKQVLPRVSEIVEFSGIGRYINEPVKHYSSGMYLRLAMSIALFTDYEILLLDEVVSVGDAEFRHRAIERVKELAAAGKTCIMISHDLDSIVALCDHCILLEKGEVTFSGSPKAVVEDYFINVQELLAEDKKMITDHPKCRFISLELDKELFLNSESVGMRIRYEKKVEEDIDIVLKVNDYHSAVMSDCEIYRPEYTQKRLPPGIYETRCVIPASLFNSGTYFIDLIFGDKVSNVLHLQRSGRFTIETAAWEANKKWNESTDNIPFRPLCNWQTKSIT